jgi:hypothetical protein
LKTPELDRGQKLIMRCRLGYLNSHGKEIYFGPPITITFIEKSAKSPISGGVSDNRSHKSATPAKD